MFRTNFNGCVLFFFSFFVNIYSVRGHFRGAALYGCKFWCPCYLLSFVAFSSRCKMACDGLTKSRCFSYAALCVVQSGV